MQEKKRRISNVIRQAKLSPFLEYSHLNSCDLNIISHNFSKKDQIKEERLYEINRNNLILFNKIALIMKNRSKRSSSIIRSPHVSHCSSVASRRRSKYSQIYSLNISNYKTKKLKDLEPKRFPYRILNKSINENENEKKSKFNILNTAQEFFDKTKSNIKILNYFANSYDNLNKDHRRKYSKNTKLKLKNKNLYSLDCKTPSKSLIGRKKLLYQEVKKLDKVYYLVKLYQIGKSHK